jgi:hypothetical protein
MFDNVTVSFLSSVGKISTDIFVVVGLIVLLVTIGLTQGKNMLLVFLVSLYPAALVAVFFPYYDLIKIGSLKSSEVSEHLTVFLVSFLVFFSIFRTFIGARHQFHTFWRFIEVFILAVTVVGLFFALLYHVVKIESYYNFSYMFDLVFITKTSLFIWLVSPLVSFPLFVRG